MVVGLKLPVRVASVGLGLAPPMEMGPPSNDRPSALRVKYDEPSTEVVPSVKCTVNPRLDKWSDVVTGQVASPEEFGPVSLTMSNSPVEPGMVTSHAT